MPRTSHIIQSPTGPTVTAPLSAGGVGWRDNVPHICILSTDIMGVSPFKPGTPIPTWIDAKPGLSYQVHINAVRADVIAVFHRQELIPMAGKPGYYEANGYFADVTSHEIDPHIEVNERHGYAGEWWVAPANAATVVETLDALYNLDIAVVSISPGFGNDGNQDWRLTPAQLNDMATNELNPNEFLTFGGTYDPLVQGAAISLLTGGTYSDGRAMNFNFYQTSPGVDANAPEDFAAAVVPDLLDLAARLGNAHSFDIALLIDDTGSFTGNNSWATGIFKALVDSFLATGLDIHVGVARFAEYAQFSFPRGGTDNSDRPFWLQYPISPVLNPADYGNLVNLLNAGQILGGGGDGPETVWEGLYQLATGVGFDGNGNGDTFDSGPSLAPGGPPFGSLYPDPEFATLAEQERYFNNPTLSRGNGWFRPGVSGDVPAFAAIDPVGTSLISDGHTRLATVSGTAQIRE